MKNSRGFTLLLSMLVISMILSVALGMTSITIKENQLSALVKESESAFHAADKGIDCALFYHISYNRNSVAIPWSPFATSSSNSFRAPYSWASVTCDGVRLDTLPTWSSTNPAAGTYRTSFRLNFGTPPGAPCVDVQVDNMNGGADSVITANGYNTCDTNSPRRTLRVIEVTTGL